MSSQCGCTASTRCDEGQRLWDEFVELTHFARQTDRPADYDSAEMARIHWARHQRAALGVENDKCPVCGGDLGQAKPYKDGMTRRWCSNCSYSMAVVTKDYERTSSRW